LSRTGVPGWETGTTAVSQPGQINVFVVVHVACSYIQTTFVNRGGYDTAPRNTFLPTLKRPCRSSKEFPHPLYMKVHDRLMATQSNQT